MTIKELIKQLQTFNPESSIEIVMRQGASPDHDIWSNIFNDVIEYQEGKKSWVVLDAQS